MDGAGLMGIFVFDIVKAFADSIAASVTAVVGSVTDLTTTTTTSVANLQNYTISTQTDGSRNPKWMAPYPIADVVFPDAMNFSSYNSGVTGAQTAGTAHTHSVAVTSFAGPLNWSMAQYESIGGYITITNPAVMDTYAMYMGRVTAGMNNIFLDIFRENPDTSLTQISSTNITASLSTTSTYLEFSLTSPEIALPGTRYMIRMRNSSTVAGTVIILGLARSTSAPLITFGTTGSSALTAQTTYSATDVVTAQATSNVVPWGMIAQASAAASNVSYSDDFNRATFGNLWLTLSSWATQLAIVSGFATYAGTANGDQHAVYIRPTNTDGNRVDFDVVGSGGASTHAGCGGFIHAAQDLSQMVYLSVTDNAVTIYSGSSSSPTSRATISTTGNDGTWSLIYNVGTNTYTAYKNGATVGLSWTDSGSLMTHDRRHRFGGVRVSRVSAVNAGTVDNWTLRDYS